MADEMIVIDASALESIDYTQYLNDYFSTVGATAGQTSYYGGEYSANVMGYFSGSQFGVRYNATTNDKQVLMEGANIQYDGVDGVHHGAYSGDVNSITFGAYDADTTYTQGEGNGPRSELTGVVAGLVVSNLDISTAFNTPSGSGNDVKTLMDTLKNAGVATDGVQTNIQKLYDLFASTAQHFIGTTGNDNYTGTEFADLIEGGTGADTLAGGLGDDIYVVTDRNNGVMEAADAGSDTIRTDISHYQIRTNVENLVQTGIAGQMNYGNELGNTMTANDFGGSLLGMGGDDTLIGGDGNDELSGDEGADVMTGGLGNDSYSVDNAGDTVTELTDGGIDTVSTSQNHYQIGDNVENLTLTGEDGLNGYGNDVDNVITGNSGANVLAGLLGNDTLDGGTGADSLYGGAGDDKYFVDNAGDAVSEVDSETGLDSGGIDTVRASVSETLGGFVEKLVLLNTADAEVPSANLTGKGNALDNSITGNAGNNKLYGFDGADIIKGGLGADRIYGGIGIDALAGGNGADTFFFKAGETEAGKKTADTITDFRIGQGDHINLAGFDANEAKKGVQDFDFIGNDAFSDQAGELRFEKSGKETYVMGDTDGDGKADFTIHLHGAFNVNEDFFVL